ncbi:MAG: hypothetical protein GTO45_35510 [Candidatus Aminicenantes bacterium]|nr:hypothetical protein [Candidatus Aminicenantes bacterium]NIM83984.1 hypothetical protein [Candidatus Aminicenantes bacterium]NIN23462.1 hypothetical protein [Candidatus Aminicenantes bacterium]NIN47167.1 hypothetical protein [Candidatus Aminicenantes bacterium]NIN90091.1 hypothetical protein [Candidatus Aminicenantes bacterium]
MRKLQNMLLSLSVLFIFAVILTFTPGNFVYAEESTYGHISYVDKEAKVIRQDHTEHKAVVNLPVAPGDQVVTSNKGRCELQFDNGTIIRLDKNTRLKVTTVLAPSLTSRRKVTTLHLLEGQIYTMVQSYGREMFQVITPNAALDLKSRSSAAIQARDNGDTFIYVVKGKFKVMYGEDTDSVKTAKLKSGNGYTITADHQLRIGDNFRDIDFMAWNDYITRNFKDLHYGISKLPRKIVRNSALMYWAEKWSSVFGEWVYDELFGYVWRPYDEYFAYSARPFFHADFVRVNGELILVPQEPWGWVPAHMGTWIWTKSGWTWVPGEAFHTGVVSFSFLPYYAYPSLSSWMYYAYGSYYHYYIYRNYGLRAWQQAYKKTYKTAVKKPSLKRLPASVRDIIKKMNNTPVKDLKERLGTTRLPKFDMKKLTPILDSKSPVKTKPPVNPRSSSTVKSKSPAKGSVPISAAKRSAAHSRWSLQKSRLLKKGRVGGGPVKSVSSTGNFRDWNPDIHWAIRTGNKVHYSSRNNEVVCSNLKINSRSMTAFQKRSIGSSASSRGNRGYGSSSSSSSDSSGSASSSTSASGSGSGSHRGGGGGGSKGGGAAGKSKQ